MLLILFLQLVYARKTLRFSLCIFFACDSLFSFTPEQLEKGSFWPRWNSFFRQSLLFKTFTRDVLFWMIFWWFFIYRQPKGKVILKSILYICFLHRKKTTLVDVVFENQTQLLYCQDIDFNWTTCNFEISAKKKLTRDACFFFQPSWNLVSWKNSYAGSIILLNQLIN